MDPGQYSDDIEHGDKDHYDEPQILSNIPHRRWGWHKQIYSQVWECQTLRPGHLHVSNKYGQANGPSWVSHSHRYTYSSPTTFDWDFVAQGAPLFYQSLRDSSKTGQTAGTSQSKKGTPSPCPVELKATQIQPSSGPEKTARTSSEESTVNTLYLRTQSPSHGFWNPAPCQ